MSSFLFLAIFANRLSSILFTASLRARLLSLAHLVMSLNLADAADVFVASSIPRRVASDAP